MVKRTAEELEEIIDQLKEQRKEDKTVIKGLNKTICLLSAQLEVPEDSNNNGAQGETNKKGGKKGSKKQLKQLEYKPDGNDAKQKVKRPKTAFQLFADDERPNVSGDFGEKQKMIAQHWRELGDERKARYNKKAADLKEKFHEEQSAQE